jgi:photosystem II stability/assembly factor-like uncharacterized protein
MAGFVAATQAGVVLAERRRGTFDVLPALERGDVRCVLVDPIDRAVLYAGTSGGVLRSGDAGRTWAAAGPDGAPTVALTASRLGEVYAASDDGDVWTTSDRAGTWEPLTRLPHGRLRARAPTALAVSPSAPDTLLAAVESRGILRSEDAGRAWTERAHGDARGVTFHAFDGEWAYAAGEDGPAVSADAGDTWERPHAGLESRACVAVAADPGRPDLWYAAADAVYRSVAGGAWEQLELAGVRVLLTDPGATGLVYGLTEDGVAWASSDFGERWERLQLELGRGLRAATLR